MKKASIITTIVGAVLMHFGAIPFVSALFFESNNPSVGIIGGADGPTAIFVTSDLFDINSVFSFIACLGLITFITGLVLLIINALKKK